ncbi:MAG: polysaccharide biosynthesis protein [Actinobacteria bacterium]|nr:polysaccharide biosynthesis protein [Actinomycetota bacterium]
MARRGRVGTQQLWTMAADLVIVLAAYYLALVFRYAGTEPEWRAWTTDFAIFAAIAIAVHLAVNRLTGIYRILNRYMSLIQAVRVGQSGILATAVLFIVVVTWPLYAGASDYLVPRSVVIGGGLLTVIAMIGMRFARRVLHEVVHRVGQTTERLLLVGAGQASDMLVREIQRTPSLNIQVVGLVDDNPVMANMSLQGYPVLGKIEDVPNLVAENDVNQIVVAVPSATAKQLARIYRLCKPAGVPVKILPSLADLVCGTISLGDARDLDIKDLLGRPKIDTNLGAISDYVQGHTVLVTGAGGSIGSELCRQIARFGPSALVLVDHDESSLYDLHERLQNQGFRRYVLCPTNILQERKLDKLFALHRPRLVFHAAAYKHVPLMELNPDEAVLNNIQGTLLVAMTAARYGVERMVNISTDKAVDPVNVMGATKRAGELVVRVLARHNPGTRFASVRFGNVLGSQGSVIPIFKSQIENGGPLVITHPEMTRYFMLIEEAVQLVIQAAVMIDEEDEDPDRSLNTFVLEMGDPVPIIELAQRMIDFYWQDQSKSIGVEFSGLRPGEKLDERLTYAYEEVVSTSHPLVKKVYAKPGVPTHNGSGTAFQDQVFKLIDMARRHEDKGKIIQGLMDCVPGYAPVDELSVEKPAVLV